MATNVHKLIWSFGVFVPIFDKWYLSKVNIWQMIFPRWTATLQTQTRLPALSAILFGPFAGAFFLQCHTISIRNITLTTSTKLPAIYITIQGVQDQPGRQRGRNTGNPDRWCLFNTQCTKHGIQCTVQWKIHNRHCKMYNTKCTVNKNWIPENPFSRSLSEWQLCRGEPMAGYRCLKS